MTRSPESDARTPLPAFQLGIILFIQAAEPITASVIFPFVNQFVLESGVTGGDERKVGYYAGIIVNPSSPKARILLICFRVGLSLFPLRICHRIVLESFV